MSAAAQLAARQATEAKRREQLTRAVECLESAHLVSHTSPTGLYLRSRAIDPVWFNVYGSVFAPKILDGRDPVHDGPAMLGTILDLTTLKQEKPRLTGVMSLSLNDDGTPRLGPDGKKFRSISGTMTGFGVPFGAPGPHLLVAEGVETMLSGMILLNIPFGVAVLNAPNMANLCIPEWVRKVTIAADNDEPGWNAARALMRVADGFGLRTEISSWGKEGSGWDANDALLEKSKTA